MSILTVAAACGDPVYTASAFQTLGSNGANCQGGGTPMSSVRADGFFVCGGSNGALQSTAVAEAGHLGADVEAETFGQAQEGRAIAELTGEAIFNDLTHPLSTDFIPLSLNIFFGGSAQTAQGSAAVNLNIFLDGNFGFLDYESNNGITTTCINTFATPWDCNGETLITTVPIMVQLNTPIMIDMALDVIAGGNAIADYSHSADFPIGSDVFNLPAGITANSADFGIVDNRFAGTSAATPEPGSIGLCLLGLGLSGRKLYRQRKLATPE
jgi:hypothetical protein